MMIMPKPENQDGLDNMYIMFMTKNGISVETISLTSKTIQSSGKITIRKDEDDSLVNGMAYIEGNHT